jgi:hypothetical protein
MKPRLLTEGQAAAYLNVPAAEVRRQGWGRIRLGIHTRYDVNALDAHLDELMGVAPQSAAPNADNDAEAALARSIDHAARRA